MTQPVRISAEETRQRVSAGSALLVCANFLFLSIEGGMRFSRIYKFR
jgi:hypothetical protein